jgi:hypothetical protein
MAPQFDGVTPSILEQAANQVGIAVCYEESRMNLFSPLEGLER